MGEPQTRTRRELLRDGTVAGAGLALWATTPGWARKRSSRLARGVAFNQGTAAGLPGPSAINLWTRVEDYEGVARLRLEIAADESFRDLVHTEVVSSRPDSDQSVKVAVKTPSLRPHQEYFYRFDSADGHSPVGRFLTLPPPDSTRPLRIGFWTCQNYVEGFWPSHSSLAADDDLDLVVCLGDYIYEYDAGVGQSLRTDTIGASGQAETLEDYRGKYRLYRTDPLLRELHSRHAMTYLWDDHEVVNNYWRDGQSALVQDGFAKRKAAAYRAWFDHQPVPHFQGGGNRVYRSLRLGALAELIHLDERQYRDPQPCGDSLLVPCPENDDPGRTMLGANQKQWLKGRLNSSDAAWKVLANGVMMMAQDLPIPRLTAYTDTWDGYAAERSELVSTWLADGVEDVIVMTGDDHNNYAGIVTTTGHDGGTPGAVEIVVPSVSSANLSEILGNPILTRLAEDVARANNPHMRLVDMVRHGYCVLELDQKEARVEFRHAASTTDPSSATSTSYRFRIPRGSIELTRI